MTTTAAPRIDLLEAKTSIPLLRPGVVRREALVARLEATDATVISVVAPGGYGKTTVLAQWSVEDPRPFAWVTVDDRDNDPVLLLRYILAALEREGIIEPAPTSSRRRTAGALWSTLVPELCAALATSEAEFVIVLDDVHELAAPETHDLLDVVVRAIPHGSQLVLAGRSELTSAVARLRAAGALVEVGTADLALTPTEAAELLAAAGVGLDDEATRGLIRHTEGWAAGLYLAALAWRADGSAPASDPSDIDRFVDDYLRAEHLSTISRKELAFLTRSSVLDRMSADICDAVLERRDSGRMLESIERANLFLVPLDRERRWYRYHEIFRAALQKELERTNPGASLELRRLAAAWCEEQELREDAMAYAIASGDLECMARQFLTLGFQLYRTGRVATLEGWLNHFDDAERLQRFPMVAVIGALVHALRGRPFQSERWLDAAERADDVGPLPDGSARVGAWRATVEAMTCRHGVERMREDAALALSELGPLSPFRQPAMLALANALLLSGDVAGADRQLEQAHDDAETVGATFVGVTALAQRALLALDRGELDAARSLATRSRDSVEFERVRGYMELGLLLAAQALIAARTGDAPAAERALAQGQQLRPDLTYAIPFYAVQTHVVMARAYLALGDVNGAQAVLLDAVEVLRHRPDLGVLVDEVAKLRTSIDTRSHPASGWESSLTAAELRLLPLLTTHLTFREIGDRLFVSRNTVKTQAISIYRKLGASSRGEAVHRAAELGLVDDSAAPSSKFTP